MSTELTKRNAAVYQWTDDFQKLVTKTVLKPKDREATGAELALLAEQSVRTGLDPMSRQIYGIFRWDSRAKDEVMTIQVGIDGLRAVAERTGRYAGGSAYLFCGEDKVWTDVWSEKAKPLAAKALVRKVLGGVVIETEAVALWSEYGLTTNVWKDKPAHMLGKCAESLALRKAFPQDLSGLYTDDEMGRADVKSPPAPLPAPVEPEVVEAEVVREDRGEDAIVEMIRVEVEAERLNKRDVMLYLTAEGASDTSSIGAALRSLTDLAFADAVEFFGPKPDEAEPVEAIPAEFDASEVPA